MNMKIYVFPLVFLILIFPVYAYGSFFDCVLEEQDIKQCIDEFNTPCIDRCQEEGNLRECVAECHPRAHCIASCFFEGEDKTECKEQCDSSIEGERCEITCLNMCQRAHCENGNCYDFCQDLCEIECQQDEDVVEEDSKIRGLPPVESSMDVEDSSAPDMDGDIAEDFEEQQQDEASSAPEPQSSGAEYFEEGQQGEEEGKIRNNCYSVCHRFCTIPCTKDCDDGDCIEECYIDCSKTCRNECAGAVESEAQEGGFNWSFEFWAMLGFLALLVTTIGGWRASSINRKESLKIMDKIENIFKEYKNDTKVCISKLEEIRKVVKDEYAEKKLDENAFNFLIKRIEHYVEELEKQNKNNLAGNNSASNNSDNAANPANPNGTINTANPPNANAVNSNNTSNTNNNQTDNNSSSVNNVNTTNNNNTNR